MDQFYSRLEQGADAALALREAKLVMLHSNGVFRNLSIECRSNCNLADRSPDAENASVRLSCSKKAVTLLPSYPTPR
jgi:CHAT domain-containing protein